MPKISGEFQWAHPNGGVKKAGKVKIGDFRPMSRFNLRNGTRYGHDCYTEN